MMELAAYEDAVVVYCHYCRRDSRLLPTVALDETAGQARRLPLIAASLAFFAWLLTLHESASNRVCEARGEVYTGVSIVWLRTVDGIRSSTWDIAGVVVALIGMRIIVFRLR